MRVFSYCKFTAVTEILVRPHFCPGSDWGLAGGSGRGWTQMCSVCYPSPFISVQEAPLGSSGEITFQLHARVSLHTWVFLLHYWPFSSVLFFLSWTFGSVKYKNVCSTETAAIWNQLFLLGRCERKLLWLRADYLPNKMLPFFWVRKCSLWSGMAAWGLTRQHFSPCNPQMQHCWVIPCFVINTTISFLLDTADAQPMLFRRITSF